MRAHTVFRTSTATTRDGARTGLAHTAIDCSTTTNSASTQGRFDVVTAIEVVEHIPGPLDTMRQIASLLKPGGRLFLTTGNAAPHRDSFTSWKYVHPDIHVAYFEPRTLTEAYRPRRP